MTAKDRIILALDVSSEGEALELVSELKDSVGAFKIGLELFTSTGPHIVQAVTDAGAERIFLDLKFHDIPNTVSGAARAAVRSGAWMFNIHASGGSEMMVAAKEASGKEADRLGVEPPLILAVTVLTSTKETMLREELGVASSIEAQVVRLARLAKDAGLDGVVASPREIGAIKAACESDFLVVTPGVRPAWAAANDQKRFTTPLEAVQNGSDYLVIGRPITGAQDRRAAAERIVQELQ
jgi:orotidine-5'-phosphate decarboxylase